MADSRGFTLVGASRSEPHTSDVNRDFPFVYIAILYQLLHDLRTDFYGTLFCEHEMFTLKISFA